jgi:hypothetical protein
MRRSSARGGARSREDGRQSIFFRDHLLLIAAVPDDLLSEPSSAGIVTTSGCSAAPLVRPAHLVCGRGSGCVRAAVSVQLGSR